MRQVSGGHASVLDPPNYLLLFHLWIELSERSLTKTGLSCRVSTEYFAEVNITRKEETDVETAFARAVPAARLVALELRFRKEKEPSAITSARTNL